MTGFLSPFLTDKRLWASAVGGLLAFLNKKFALGLDGTALATLAAGLAAYAVAHIAHENTVGKTEEK